MLCTSLESKSQSLEKQKAEVANNRVNLKARSMRENLIFYRIPKQARNNGDHAPEDP